MLRENALQIISTFSPKIPSQNIPQLKAALRNSPDSVVDQVYSVKTYSATTTLLLSIFFRRSGYRQILYRRHWLRHS